MEFCKILGPAITLSELESHLWAAANILRGSPVDRTDWKSYILPLLSSSASAMCGTRNSRPPRKVERIVTQIDEIMRLVRFPGWQNTSAGERRVRKALRKTLFDFKLHQDT